MEGVWHVAECVAVKAQVWRAEGTCALGACLVARCPRAPTHAPPHTPGPGAKLRSHLLRRPWDHHVREGFVGFLPLYIAWSVRVQNRSVIFCRRLWSVLRV